MAKPKQFKLQVTFENTGFKTYDILVDGDVVGSISGMGRERWVRLQDARQQGQLVPVARFKYRQPVLSAKEFVTDVMSRMAATEVVERLHYGSKGTITPLALHAEALEMTIDDFTARCIARTSRRSVATRRARVMALAST